MRVPDVRDELRSMAAQLRMLGHVLGPKQLADRMDWWALQLERKPRATQAPVTAARMTPALAESIRAMAASHPGMRQDEIGRRHGVNQGRVSEVLAGKRR